MAKTILIEEFLNLAAKHPIVDVRTPAEFQAGHIPQAANLPLFTNEERKIIGTIYKQEGREPAILKGLELIGPKLKDFVKLSLNIHLVFGDKQGNVMNANGRIDNKTLLLYCWRGGMRSASVAWLLELYGFKIFLLKGGYKSFRRATIGIFNQPRKLLVLGGKTGSGKTVILNELNKNGQQIVDLEAMANHKGSSFGALGEAAQPSQEQFENLLANALRNSDAGTIVWLEDESRSVGKVIIPLGLWSQMRSCKVIDLQISFDDRVKNLIRNYGQFEKEELKAAVERIKKRLGGLNFKFALLALDKDDIKSACEIILSYYDKAYNFGIGKRDPLGVIPFPFGEYDVQQIARELINMTSNKYI